MMSRQGSQQLDVNVRVSEQVEVEIPTPDQLEATHSGETGTDNERNREEVGTLGPNNTNTGTGGQSPVPNMDPQPGAHEAPAYTIADDLLLEHPPSLTEVIALGDRSVDIHQSILGRYSEDPFFKWILENPSAFKNFEVSSDRIILKDKERRALCIPDVKIGKRRVREILISHAHSILAHLGPSKTVTYLRENVWWKGMGSDVQAFCSSCPTCQSAKPSNHQPYGLLETLEVPSRPWETIGIDFVGPLPESRTLNGSFDMILVAIDHLTSMVHLAPTKQTYHARDIAEILHQEKWVSP